MEPVSWIARRNVHRRACLPPGGRGVSTQTRPRVAPKGRRAGVAAVQLLPRFLRELGPLIEDVARASARPKDDRPDLLRAPGPAAARPGVALRVVVASPGSASPITLCATKPTGTLCAIEPAPEAGASGVRRRSGTGIGFSCSSESDRSTKTEAKNPSHGVPRPTSSAPRTRPACRRQNP